MRTTPPLRVFFFDVFGTCVAQRKPVADELWKASQEALESDVSSINSEVRIKATNMSYERRQFSTITLSNTFNELLQNLVAHSSIPFTHVHSADLFHSFKPNSKVYLGAAEKMGAKPNERALVAAHLSDLKGAKLCGSYTIYVERPLEEKSAELREENIPHMVIKEDEDGFVALAGRFRDIS